MDNKDLINVVYFTDENYWYPVLVSALSAVQHLSDQESIVFYILHNGIQEKYQNIFTTILSRRNVVVKNIYVSEEPYKKYPDYHGSKMVYFRLDAWRLLPEVSWCIFVDGDTLWCQSPEKVWQYRNDRLQIIGSHDIIGVHEGPKYWCAWHKIPFNNDTYFCAGFFLFNLKRYRDEKLFEKADEILSRCGMPPMNEQDVFNIVCSEKELLPLEWGVFAKYGYLRDVSMLDIGCIHYVRDLPWKRDKMKNLSSDIVEMWWKNAKRVPVPMPPEFRAVRCSLKYWLLRILFKIWKNCSFLWHIKYLYVRFGNEWPQEY